MKNLTQSPGKTAGECGASVSDNLHWETMVLPHIVSKKLSCFQGINIRFTRRNVGHFGEFIHKDQDGVMTTVCDRKLHNIVHRHTFPEPFRYFNRIQRSTSFLLIRLIKLTRTATLDISSHIFPHAWPLLQPLQEIEGFLSTTMPTVSRAVCLVHDCLPNFRDIRDNNTPVVYPEIRIGSVFSSSLVT